MSKARDKKRDKRDTVVKVCESVRREKEKEEKGRKRKKKKESCRSVLS